MHRIDENTYIDDTLVTCAEYQLFIDEMRAQGKYYQPDHWIFYQFQAGKAREPILGPRLSDAKAFCEWLTQRDGGMWKYRLPSREEALNHVLKTPTQVPLGYWVTDVDDQYHFIWIDPIPIDARGINGDFGIDIQHDLDHAIARARLRGLILEYNFARDLDLVRTHISIIHRVIARRLDRALVHARDRAIAFDQDFSLVLTRDLGLRIDHTPLSVFDVAHDLDLAFVIDHNIDCNLVRRHTLSLAHDLKNAHDLAHVLALTIGRSIARDIDRIFNDTLDLFVDVFTIQERIIARSPAFEGIRLVKERIR